MLYWLLMQCQYTKWQSMTKNCKSFVGLVDYGTAVPEADATEATEVLVFMIVGLTDNWKHPVGYVFQNKCSANVHPSTVD